MRNLIPLLLCAGLWARLRGDAPGGKEARRGGRPGHLCPARSSAEAALKRGECRQASELYAKAASGGDAQLARRATQVAMACEHLPAAWQSATRWRSLAPTDREANALYAAVALKLYRTNDARTAIHEFWRVEEQTNSAAPAAKGAPRARAPRATPVPHKPEERTARSMTELTALLLEESDASAVLIAMSGALEPSANSTDTLILLGELALAAYDGQRAGRYAQQALQHDPNDLSALRILSRAYVMRGNGPQALATAREAATFDAERGGLRARGDSGLARSQRGGPSAARAAALQGRAAGRDRPAPGAARVQLR